MAGPTQDMTALCEVLGLAWSMVATFKGRYPASGAPSGKLPVKLTVVRGNAPVLKHA